MKNDKKSVISRVVFFWIFGICTVQAQVDIGGDNEAINQLSTPSGQVIYTFYGTKDPRLNATFEASYVSTSKSEDCSHRNPTTSTRKVTIGSKRYPITEEHYRVDIPIYLEENENVCGYRFSRIELVLRRLYDKELYSRHILLSQKPIAYAIYKGTRGGFGSQASLIMPARLTTEKRFFRISKKTQYLCRTKFYPTLKSTDLICFMRIRNGEGKNKFIPINRPETFVTHPEFGVDDIKSETIEVNILADDLGSLAYTGKEILQDHFRSVPKPRPTLWEKITKSTNQWFK